MTLNLINIKKNYRVWGRTSYCTCSLPMSVLFLANTNEVSVFSNTYVLFWITVFLLIVTPILLVNVLLSKSGKKSQIFFFILFFFWVCTNFYFLNLFYNLTNPCLTEFLEVLTCLLKFLVSFFLILIVLKKGISFFLKNNNSWYIKDPSWWPEFMPSIDSIMFFGTSVYIAGIFAYGAYGAKLPPELFTRFVIDAGSICTQYQYSIKGVTHAFEVKDSFYIFLKNSGINTYVTALLVSPNVVVIPTFTTVQFSCINLANDLHTFWLFSDEQFSVSWVIDKISGGFKWKGDFYSTGHKRPAYFTGLLFENYVEPLKETAVCSTHKGACGNVIGGKLVTRELFFNEFHRLLQIHGTKIDPFVFPKK